MTPPASLAIVLSGFVLALFAPAVHRLARGAAGWLLALLPLGITLYLGGFLPAIAAGQVFTTSQPWVPSLGVNLSFRLDALSLLFALLIAGIGALVFIYSGGYLAGHARLGRFYGYLSMFMASMLGVVLADNVIALFVFWELTSLSSYLLIGFEREREAARSAALQALLVTGLGGLALLAGFILLGQAGGSLELSALLEQGGWVRSSPLYLPILLLVLAGAFTKSAQFPFHFWLPNAMEAPTPVSAYLHSATMVKAGVYLLARLHPVLGETDAWFYAVVAGGAATMLVGAWLALQETDLKRILAYSTVSALGILTLLLGVGTAAALAAAMTYLLAHALYKGALFLVAGVLDHQTGLREVEQLGGLRKVMPVTAAAAVLAAVSMAGVPPLFGFTAKEMFYEALAHDHLLLFAAVFASALLVAVAAVVALKPFFGPAQPTPKIPHEAPVSLWLGPVVLAGVGFLLGPIAGAVGDAIVVPSADAVLGRDTGAHLSLWHGLNFMLLLSALTLAAGLGLAHARTRIRRAQRWVWPASAPGPERAYGGVVAGSNALARFQTRLLQSGYLRGYLMMILATAVGLGGWALVSRAGIVVNWSSFSLRFHEAGVAVLILAAAVAVVRSSSRLAAIAALGVVGFGVALLYVLFGAPDLAMTQILVETLTVILFVLVFYHLPRFTSFSSPRVRARDAVAALAVGGFVSALVLAATAAPGVSRLTSYFAANSYASAHGRNVVNVILVDFRALDTLGEITVLAVAGIGVFALLKLRRPRSFGVSRTEPRERGQA